MCSKTFFVKFFLSTLLLLMLLFLLLLLLLVISEKMTELYLKLLEICLDLKTVCR